MKIGSYVRHHLYRDRGEIIYRYGIVLNIIYRPIPPLASVFWNITPSELYINNNSRYEIIKMQVLELISEPS